MWASQLWWKTLLQQSGAYIHILFLAASIWFVQYVLPAKQCWEIICWAWWISVWFVSSTGFEIEIFVGICTKQLLEPTLANKQPFYGKSETFHYCVMELIFCFKNLLKSFIYSFCRKRSIFHNKDSQYSPFVE